MSTDTPAAATAEPMDSCSPEDRAFYRFWYGHMLNDLMQPPLAGISHATARYIWNAALSAPVAAMNDLCDEGGENQAVRAFLMQHGQPDVTVEAMKLHLSRSGYPFWPAWVEWETAQGHLTKAGAQSWLRHLFALEGAPVAAQPAASGVDALWVETKIMELAKVSFAAGIAHGHGAKNDWCTDGKAFAIIDAVRTHLSTALTGAANKKEN